MGHLYGCLVRAAHVVSIHHELSLADSGSADVQRRRCEYAAVYHMDKIYATFKAHPPLMFRRFATTRLPEATTEIDSYLRGQCQLAVAREEVLEWILASSARSKRIGVQYV